MPDYHYVAWFRDHTLQPDDQDYEWVVCFVVAAIDGHAALSWGDRLSASYSRRHEGCEFLRSYLDSDRWEVSVPRVVAGKDATDEFIGW